MQKNFLTILTACALASLMSCGKDEASGISGARFSIRSDYEIADRVKSLVSDLATIPSPEDFKLTIRDSENEVFWEGLLAEWSAETLITAGEYTVTAEYGSESDEGRDKPWIKGVKDFTVTAENVTDVQINVSLANTAVRIACTEAFSEYVSDYSFVLVTGGGTVIEFTPDNTEAAFMEAYRFTLSGSMTNQGGTVKTISAKEYDNLEPRTCYTLKFDVQDIGGDRITVTFDDSVETVELEPIELND